MLPDGRYDVIVVDAAGGPQGLRLDVTVLDGEHKGEVVSVRAEGLGTDELGALGMPGTLTVANGEPALVLEH